MNTLDPTRSQAVPGDLFEDPNRTPAAVRIGYLFRQYPALPQACQLEEVLGLRARGIPIETASLNRPERPSAELPPLEAAEARRTHYIRQGRKAHTLRNLLLVCLGRPDALLRGLLALLRIPGLSLGERALWFCYLAEAMLVGRWMKLRRLDHLHLHHGGPEAAVGLLTSLAWRVPYSITLHGPAEFRNIESHHLKAKIAHASFVLCTSDFARSQLCATAGPALWSKFLIVRLGVDPLVLTPPLRPVSFSMRSDSLKLVCTARLVPAKGQMVLLEAVRLLRERGLTLHVTLIGDGPERARLEEFVSHHALTGSVRFTGALSHATTLVHLQRADLFALASFAESIPVALMEAMSLGLPCVGTAIAGIPELIRTGVDGLLVPPANAPAFAQALESMINDPVLRRSLGASARQRIITQYNLPLNHELLALTFRTSTAAAASGPTPGRTQQPAAAHAPTRPRALHP